MAANTRLVQQALARLAVPTALTLAGLFGGCRPGEPVGLVRSDTSCGVTERSGVSRDLVWFRPADGERLIELEQWCDTVGPPLVSEPVIVPVETPSMLRSGDPLIVVSWNVHVGRGDVVRLVRRLRTELDASDRSGHIILLLQEALRRDDTVPATEPSHFALPDAIRPRHGEPADIDDVARGLGLWLFYAPSMRNGEEVAPGRREDRGNAIMSSLPFLDPRVIELPLGRQRRAAVSIDIPTASQAAPSVRFVSAHIDTLAGGRQAAALASVLGDWRAEAPLFIGADLNALFGPLDPRVRRVHGEVQRHDCGGRTYMHLLSLDHVFTSLDSWVRSCRVMSDRYGSDHAPVVAQMVVP